MDEQQITAKIIQVLQQVAPEVEGRILDPAVNFRDQCEIDSVDFLNFVLTLEKSLGIKIPEMDYPKFSSLQGCLSYLTAGPEEKPLPQSSSPPG
jgi:acyl carrier protein